MRIYIGFDDTDTAESDRGTGRLAREFADQLPDGCRLWGVLRQQLPRLPGVPYTSNNSAACVAVDAEDASLHDTLVDLAVDHLRRLFIEGSDPGLCVAREGCAQADGLIAFGRTCCNRVVTQKEAMAAAQGLHLSGHGGTNDGIIGAAAGVGLTFYGWSGRFVAFGSIRSFPDPVRVGMLEDAGIRVLSMARDAMLPSMDDTVETEDWLRPRLWGLRPVLPVERLSENRWRAVGIKRERRHGAKHRP